jgi:hypothetical protein
MPLLDHFRPPLSIRRRWHSFHHAWATSIASALNERLPEDYFAELNVQFGIEIDVKAGSPEVWTSPSPSLTIPFSVVTDSVEVLVYEVVEGPILAGAIELVSPANKDRPAHREAFVSKSETYLNDGIGLVMVDIVTVRGGNLHGELLARLLATDEGLSGDLYASAYRPGPGGLEIWREPMTVGLSLPTMPLGLKGGPCLPVDLEATYERTRRELRMADGF